jgi:hypothetical protein
MAKFCSNGHQMEDSWEICPYCQRTGFQTPTGAGGGAAKTRLESDPAPGGPAPAAAGAAVGRKTVLLSEKRKPPVVGWFVAMSGDQKGEDFRIRDGQNTIGSGAENDIVIHDSTVSSKHASIRYRDSKFFVTDLDSTNGTHLNDGSEPIAREELKDNDLLRVGDVSLKFKCL